MQWLHIYSINIGNSYITEFKITVKVNCELVSKSREPALTKEMNPLPFTVNKFVSGTKK